MDPEISKLIDEDMIIPVLAIVCGTLIAIVGIMFTMIRGMVVTKAREQTKRELAAYVAEGTMEPDKAIAILEAGRSAEDGEGGCCGGKRPAAKHA